MKDIFLLVITDHFSKILALSILFISSIYFRFLLEIFGQTWIRTKAHTATLTILPIITYVITNVISGNIALSLGMVGALSIVRFRNPVRSPLELSAYFASITMGISASVSILWLCFLVGGITFAIILLVIIDILFSKFSANPLFISSFSEGNTLSTLSINSNTSIDVLENSNLLISKTKSDNKISYTLASHDFEKLKNLESMPEVVQKSFFTELNR